ncbi:protein kinase [Strigomonas culicis]|uniref:Protein kinase n=1 Tax=Strigomonas culicis TaxID=28005 RepID=S9W454_9TRYP|nr:protein kinase [Strigomonas culicis]EPY30595.1 protein kinase [Strigomonas culicis]|eukprot:EPY23781.1 protein kinase [Strigomonas culicis]
MSLLPFPERGNVDSFYQCDDIYDFLGEGTFASVYKAVCICDGEKVKTGQPVALKMINKRDLTTEKMLRDVINEVEVLRLVDHPNCVKLLDYFQTPFHVVIVMSFVPGKELFQALREAVFTEEKVKEVMLQLLSALQYLHDSIRVVHRDIKPENVLMSPLDDGNYHVTLVDFGLARVLARHESRRRLGANRSTFSSPMQRLAPYPPAKSASVDSLDHLDSPFLATPCGTLKYAAPETIKSLHQKGQLNTTRDLLPRVDIYATGVLMYVMLCGALPFRDLSNKVALFREMEAGPSFADARWEQISRPAVALNQALLSSDPNTRPRAGEALRYEWFTGDTSLFNGSSTECMKVDEILGERAYVVKAFSAMQPPESDLFTKLENDDGAGPQIASRCFNVPFTPGDSRKTNVYF